MKKQYRIKVSGSKLRILSNQSCVSIDLDAYPVLTVQQNQKQVSIVGSDGKLISAISFETASEAKNVCSVVSRKILRKNRKFRASVFVFKIALAVLLYYLALSLFAATVKNHRIKAYNKAMMVQYQKQMKQQQAKPVNMQADIDKAKGQAMSVDDIFYVNE